MSDGNQMIFIVDDDQDIRTSLTRALTQRGFEVEAFASGREFLAAYDGEQAACLVLDHGMPGMSGLELQALLNGQGSPLAVVFITGHGGVPGIGAGDEGRRRRFPRKAVSPVGAGRAHRDRA